MKNSQISSNDHKRKMRIFSKDSEKTRKSLKDNEKKKRTFKRSRRKCIYRLRTGNRVQILLRNREKNFNFAKGLRKNSISSKYREQTGKFCQMIEKKCKFRHKIAKNVYFVKDLRKIREFLLTIEKMRLSSKNH